MNEKIYKEELNTLINDKYDLIVCGSGPSGVSAAISAGRQGIKTLLIEQLSNVGGMSTMGMMSHWTGNCDNRLYREILTRAKDVDNSFFDDDENKIYIDSERLKLTYQEMLIEANVDVLYYTFVCDCFVENNTIKGVIVENKTGRTLYTSKVVIDATGDGDIAYKCNVPFTNGRDDGKMQPATLMFKVGGVEKEKAVLLGSFESTHVTDKGELQALAKKNLPHPLGHVLLYDNPLPGVITVNMTNVTNINGCLTEDLTKAEVTCRKQMYLIRDFLREYVPGFENCYIITSASFMGIRETRHFEGKYTLNENDILTARDFDDWAVRGAYFNFDVHGLDDSGLDPTGSQRSFKQKNAYDIPYRCFVPINVEGLLIAGRCISGTHMAHANYRAMPICVAMGEACGIAASVAIKDNVLPSKIDIKKVQNLL